MDRMPTYIRPMLCTLVRIPFDDPEYLFEIKWDGYRIVSSVVDGKVRMNSRSGLDYTSRYPTIEKALKQLGHDVLIDGEVVVFGADDKPDFDAVQLYNGHETEISYCVFDLMWLNGSDLTKLPLVQRKALLQQLVKGKKGFRYSESFDSGTELYQKCLDEDLEGIVAKVKESSYQSGARNSSWLKVPTKKRQEFVIGGWVESDTALPFKSMLFGAYENGKFHWIGRSGSGYKQKEMPAILEKFEALEVNKSPFANKAEVDRGDRVHWMKPELVANFEFATWTKSGRIRKPAIFQGFRYDKNPKDVVREIAHGKPSK